jgi:hypothetical protein
VHFREDSEDTISLNDSERCVGRHLSDDSLECYAGGHMDTHQITALLIAERDRLQAAIELLEGPSKKRGRPKDRRARRPNG